MIVDAEFGDTASQVLGLDLTVGSVKEPRRDRERDANPREVFASRFVFIRNHGWDVVEPFLFQPTVAAPVVEEDVTFCADPLRQRAAQAPVTFAGATARAKNPRTGVQSVLPGSATASNKVAANGLHLQSAESYPRTTCFIAPATGFLLLRRSGLFLLRP